MSAIAFALSSSFLFAFSLQMQAMGLREVSARIGTLVTIGSTTLAYWLVSPLFVERWYWFDSAILIFAAIGLIRPFLSVNLALAGVRLLGPTLASTLGGTTPLFGALFGVLWLGEEMTWPILTGTLAIVAGVVLLARSGRVRMDWPLWAILLPMGASLIRSFGHAWTKVGMEALPSPAFAAMIGTTVSLVIALIAERKSLVQPVASINWRAQRWFVLAGLTNAVSLFSLNNALNLGDIIVVIPVVATSPVVTLLLSRFVFRQDSIDLRKVTAVALIVPAVILIAAAG